MSRVQVETASLLLRDHYGAIVSEVGSILLRARSLPLPLIVMRSKLGVNKVKQSLRVLIQHHFVEFLCDTSTDRNRHVEYRCYIDRILLLSRYPRYMISAKKLYGDAAELIIEELLANGQLSLSNCVQKVTKRLEMVGEGSSLKAEDVKHQFVLLVETHFICRCPEINQLDDPSDVPEFRPVSDPYVLPDRVTIHGTDENGNVNSSTQRKRKLDEKSPEPDAAVLWRVNVDKFHDHFRDQYMLNIARNRIDENAETVLRAVLRSSELRTSPGARESVQLSFNEIMKLIPDSSNLVKAQVTQYLSLLCDDQSRMMRRVGEAGGGLYVIDFTSAMKAICLSSIQSIIQERHGGKALRIFNLLLAKGHLEQNEMETYAMLPSKEGKELSYSLLAQGIISTKEVPKTNDFAPSRTFYLFHVNFDNVMRMLCDKSYKTIANLILRRCYENEEHKSLLERQERLDAITANIRLDNALTEEMKDQHIQELEDVYLTTAEKQTLEKFRGWIVSLQQAETEVDESVLIFNLYMKYS